jgi:acetoin utilization protein AcuB
MKVRKIMHTDVVALQADEPLLSAVEATTSEHIRHVPILEGEQLIGMVSATDIKHATPSPLVEGNEAEYRKVLNETPLRRIMRRAPITARPDATLAEIVRLMVENRIGAIPIVDAGKLVGIISELDVLRTFQTVLEALE